MNAVLKVSRQVIFLSISEKKESKKLLPELSPPDPGPAEARARHSMADGYLS